MLLDEECKDCLYNSQLKKVAKAGGGEKLEEFKARVKALCENPPNTYCAPLLMRDIDGIHRRIYGCGIDYSREKRLFNGALLNLEPALYQRVKAAADPLAEAMKLAMAANYIDFARISDLDESAVGVVLKAAERALPDPVAFASLKHRLECAQTLCFLHDNCGEIVLDKILIRIIKEICPQIRVFSVVRGSAIINDVTAEDAEEVGLGEYAEVVSNGAGVPGTYLKEISARTKELLENCGVIISKGLGNLETLYGEGYGAFYSFTCKCAHIAERFGAKIGDAVLTEEL